MVLEPGKRSHRGLKNECSGAELGRGWQRQQSAQPGECATCMGRVLLLSVIVWKRLAQERETQSKLWITALISREFEHA